MDQETLVETERHRDEADESTEPNGPAEPAGFEAADAEPGAPQLVERKPVPSMHWKLWVRDLIIAAAASVLIITFLYQPVRVEGISMLPRLVDQDRLFINKFAYHLSAIERGDVVVFRYPRDERKSYIKRIIAVPGDRVRIDLGQVYVNEQALSEPYVPEEYRDTKSMDPLILRPGEYFVLGDHRSIASDSREFGTVKRDLIYGKAAFVYWPSRDVGVVH